MHEVLIHSPYPRQKSQGNAVTARRMKGLLLDGGYELAIHERGDAPMLAKCLIALNARKSAGEIFDFSQRQPESKIITLLTGTDVNHPDMEDSGSDAIKALELSDQIVSLHEGFSHRIPNDLLEKVRVIYPSVQLPADVGHVRAEPAKVIVAGNFRDEKNPNLLMSAARELVDFPIQIEAYGHGGDYEAVLQKTAEECEGFHFYGVQDHEVLLQAMQSAHVLLNTSTEEGGANAICEAVVIGLPVIASRIDGNLGMLGKDYGGFFQSENTADLTEILMRSQQSESFYQGLKEQISMRAPLFSYQHEAEQWAGLVEEMIK